MGTPWPLDLIPADAFPEELRDSWRAVVRDLALLRAARATGRVNKVFTQSIPLDAEGRMAYTEIIKTQSGLPPAR